MTDEQAAWLRENELPRQRWLYSENARSLIDEMEDAGLMRAVSGEFMMRPQSGHLVTLLGKELPVVGTLISLYMLTPYGRTQYLEKAPT